MKNRSSQPATMRIAIAGAGGFARILAQSISQTAHPVLIMSRSPHPELAEQLPGCQLAMVDYEDVDNLHYTLLGVDLVISTIAGTEQLNLIDAARRARVRRFVPSEFEGDMSHRPADDPLERGGPAAIEFLEQQSRSQAMPYTVFACGIFMERFAPGGLQEWDMGAGCGIQAPNDYLVNIQDRQAEIVPTNASGRPARVAMTSVYDVARFVTSAIELGLGNWPREFRMLGDCMTVEDIVRTCSDARQVSFNLRSRQYQEVEGQIVLARTTGDWPQYYYLQRLLQTANGRYHVRSPNLNDAVNQSEATQVHPVTFRAWLDYYWGPEV
ncbi:hypothetical protein QBC35DRAFT_22921 [Podospora australis]|uniref:NmrA-like domain-containing protein n=1 Tax=Podospora australis TaxID=1536484 RepID=A0AAN6WZN9_9PEZI|nr:hypothetical protein QBC35DRAFT_22921 [Podospora australis]